MCHVCVHLQPTLSWTKKRQSFVCFFKIIILITVKYIYVRKQSDNICTSYTMIGVVLSKNVCFFIFLSS